MTKVSQGYIANGLCLKCFTTSQEDKMIFQCHYLNKWKMPLDKLDKQMAMPLDKQISMSLDKQMKNITNSTYEQKARKCFAK